MDIVDDVVEDKDDANKLKFQIQRQLIETKGSELEAQAKIVLAEAQGSWLQRNWRPLLMAIFAGLVVAHWFGFTASNIPESVQNSLINIVMVGVGVHVICCPVMAYPSRRLSLLSLSAPYLTLMCRKRDGDTWTGNYDPALCIGMPLTTRGDFRACII